MLLTQIMTPSSIPEALAEYDAKVHVIWVLLGVSLGWLVIIGGVAFGVVHLAQKLPNKLLRYIVGWSSVLVAGALLVGATSLVDPVHIKSPRQLENTIETIVHEELTAQYRIEDVQIDEPTREDGTNLGVIYWARTLTDDSLEPTKIIVRTEQGPTVPYEIRLTDDTLRLYNLHGDTTVPDPQELRR